MAIGRRRGRHLVVAVTGGFSKDVVEPPEGSQEEGNEETTDVETRILLAVALPETDNRVNEANESSQDPKEHKDEPTSPLLGCIRRGSCDHDG